MNRRELIKGGGLALGVLAVGGSTACGPSKVQAIRYTDLAINYLHDVTPILTDLGGTQVVTLINKAIPALEKLKQYLQNNDFPQAGNFFDTVTGVLGQVATALLQLPPSTKRATAIGIVTLVNITLRTVSLFIESETPPNATASIPLGVRRAAKPDAIMTAFQASRF